jgi:DNA primase
MLRGEDMVEARKYVADHEDFALDPYEREDTDEPISIMSEGVLDQFAEAHPGLEIIQKRRITQEAVEHFGLMWDLREARLIFPIRNESGRLVGVRGRASEQTRSKIKYREYSELSSGGSLKANGIWFGMQFRPEDGQKLILVEGELDAVKLWQAIRRPVWAAMGSSIHRAQIARVQALSKPVLLFFDADDAGREASSKLARKLKNVLGAGVFEVTKYGASKDPAELVDAGSLRQALKSIKQVT